MDTPGFGSPIHTYQNSHRMRVSNDRDGSEATHLNSLGVVDLDLSLSPDVLGLKAFNNSLPITRMLPGSSPCELRLLLPDSNIGTDGFHDVIIENLSTSSMWRSRHVSPSDMTSLRRRWPKAVFKTTQRRGKEMEHLRRQACRRPEWAFRHKEPGFCPMCRIVIGHPHDVLPSRVGTTVALSGRVVCGMERLGQ